MAQVVRIRGLRIRRRSEVLTGAFDMGECDPKMIEEYSNLSDPQTKYLVYRVCMRHLHYTHNLPGEPPPPVYTGDTGAQHARA